MHDSESPEGLVQGLGGLLTSDPAPATDPSGTWVFVRGGDQAMYAQHFTGGAWVGFTGFGGLLTSGAAAVGDPAGVTAFVRGGDGALYLRRASAGALMVRSSHPSRILSVTGTDTAPTVASIKDRA